MKNVYSLHIEWELRDFHSIWRGYEIKNCYITKKLLKKPLKNLPCF